MVSLSKEIEEHAQGALVSGGAQARQAVVQQLRADIAKVTVTAPHTGGKLPCRSRRCASRVVIVHVPFQTQQARTIVFTQRTELDARHAALVGTHHADSGPPP